MTTAIHELAALDQWVITKLVPGRDKHGNLKYDKPPLKLNQAGDDLIGASHSEPLDWATYAVACEVVARGIGGAQALGFCFHESDPYTGVDFDGCRDPQTGIIEPWAWYWIRKLNSYTEISKSGTGVKVWVRGKLPKALSWKPNKDSIHTGIEVYSRQRFFWLTGERVAAMPETINDAQLVLEEMVKELAPPSPAPRKVSPGERAAERMAGGTLVERILRENDLGDLLESHGARLISQRGGSRYYSGLNGDQHTHRYTYVVSEARSKPGQIGHSYSDSGKLNKADYPRGFDYLNAIEALEGKTIRDFAPAPEPAAKIINFNNIQVDCAPAKPSIDQAAAYNAARREKRHQETREALDAIYGIADSVDFTRAVPTGTSPEAHDERARLLFVYLLTTCYDRGVLQVAPTNEQLSSDLDMCERYVQYAFRELEAAGIGKRQGGRGGLGQPNKAATWTFYRLPHLGCKPQQDAICTLVIDRRDPIGIPVDSCEGGAIPLGEPDSLDTWAWCEDEHGAAELNALDCEPDTLEIKDNALTSPTPQTSVVSDLQPAAAPARTLLSCVRVAAREVAEPAWYLRDYDDWTEADLRVEYDRLMGQLDARQEAAESAAGLAPEGVGILTTPCPAEPEPDTPGASYDPDAPLPPPDPRAVPAGMRIAGDIAMERRADDAGEQLDQADLFAPAPAAGVPFIRPARAAQILEMPPALRGWAPKHAAQARKARDALAALAHPPLTSIRAPDSTPAQGGPPL